VLIGELAEQAATSPRTLRYYESRGLVRPRRSANGYRLYDQTELRVVTEIRTLLAAGFDLDGIRPFVARLRAGNSSGNVCPDSVTVLHANLPRSTPALSDSAWCGDRARARARASSTMPWPRG
jgi:DNA-binding transcriptional MerR regulator